MDYLWPTGAQRRVVNPINWWSTGAQRRVTDKLAAQRPSGARLENVLMVVVIRSEVHKHIFLGGVTLLPYQEGGLKMF